MGGGKRQKAAKCLHLKGAEAGRSMLQPPMPCLRQNRGAEGLGADPGGEVGSVSPLLQAKQLCPRSQLRVAQPLPAGTDGLAEREESFGTLGPTWTQPHNGLLLCYSSAARGWAASSRGPTHLAPAHLCPPSPPRPPLHHPSLACLPHQSPPSLSDKVNRVEREHLFMRRLSSERQ